MRATVAIKNFTKPRLDIAAVMEADLKALSRFFMPDPLEEISGKLLSMQSSKGRRRKLLTAFIRRYPLLSRWLSV
ncbi:MAG: hypothetical protein IPK08_07860 [Bacteroidetes bacterium]|nr:hypothetical protein [Bacteroidota bacterium]